MTKIDTHFNANIDEKSVRVEFIFPFPLDTMLEPVEFICDFDERDDLIGLETLDLNCSAGLPELSLIGKATHGLTRQGRVSYYEKGKAFYVNLTGRPKSLKQRVCNGFLFFDTAKRLIGLSASYPVEQSQRDSRCGR